MRDRLFVLPTPRLIPDWPDWMDIASSSPLVVSLPICIGAFVDDSSGFNARLVHLQGQALQLFADRHVLRPSDDLDRLENWVL